MDFEMQRFSRDSEDVKYRGNRRLSGSWGRVWLNGELLFSISSFSATVTADREDIFIGIDKDSKIVSLSGDGEIVIKQVFTHGYHELLEDYKAGHDTRFDIVASLDDPDTIGSQSEVIKISNVWFDSLEIMTFSKASVVEKTLTFHFTASDLSYLSTIEKD